MWKSWQQQTAAQPSNSRGANNNNCGAEHRCQPARQACEYKQQASACCQDAMKDHLLLFWGSVRPTLPSLHDLRLCNVAERTMSCGCSSSSKQHHNPATEGARTTASAAQGTDASRPGRPASTAAVNLTSFCSGVLSALRFRACATFACATLQRGQCHVAVVAAANSSTTQQQQGREQQQLRRRAQMPAGREGRQVLQQ